MKINSLGCTRMCHWVQSSHRSGRRPSRTTVSVSVSAILRNKAWGDSAKRANHQNQKPKSRNHQNQNPKSKIRLTPKLTKSLIPNPLVYPAAAQNARPCDVGTLAANGKSADFGPHMPL